MRFYKYPYLSIFIVGYYLLEHQGYYYKLREIFGYSEDDEVNYLVPVNRQAFTQLAKAPDRKFMLLMRTDTSQPQALVEAKQAAKKAKERLCSPIIFGEVDCGADTEFCKELGQQRPTEFVYVDGGKTREHLQGEIEKKTVLKFLKHIQRREEAAKSKP